MSYQPKELSGYHLLQMFLLLSHKCILHSPMLCNFLRLSMQYFYYYEPYLTMAHP